MLQYKLKSHLNKLNESNQQAPRMRPIDNQALQQYSSNLLLDHFLQSMTSMSKCGGRSIPLSCNLTSFHRSNEKYF